MEQQRVHHAEHRGVCANPERQSKHRDGRKSGVLAQRTHRVAEILKDRFKQLQVAHLAIEFLRLLDAAQLHQRIASRLFEAHASAQILFDVYPEMAVNLRGKFPLTLLPAKQSRQTKQRRPQGSHDCSSPGARNRTGIKVLCRSRLICPLPGRVSLLNLALRLLSPLVCSMRRAIPRPCRGSSMYSAFSTISARVPCQTSALSAKLHS